MNGLLRDYFPKGTDFAVVDADELHDRPRKTLGWSRPRDIFQSALAAH